MSERTPESRMLCRIGLSSLVLYIVLAVFFWTSWSFKVRRIDEIVERFNKLPVLDDRSDDEILGYNEQGHFD